MGESSRASTLGLHWDGHQLLFGRKGTICSPVAGPILGLGTLLSWAVLPFYYAFAFAFIALIALASAILVLVFAIGSFGFGFLLFPLLGMIIVWSSDELIPWCGYSIYFLAAQVDIQFARALERSGFWGRAATAIVASTVLYFDNVRPAVFLFALSAMPVNPALRWQKERRQRSQERDNHVRRERQAAADRRARNRARQLAEEQEAENRRRVEADRVIERNRVLERERVAREQQQRERNWAAKQQHREEVEKRRAEKRRTSQLADAILRGDRQALVEIESSVDGPSIQWMKTHLLALVDPSDPRTVDYGEWAVDLHGYRAAQAESVLLQVIEDATAHRLRQLVVVHGGDGSNPLGQVTTRIALHSSAVYGSSTWLSAGSTLLTLKSVARSNPRPPSTLPSRDYPEYSSGSSRAELAKASRVNDSLPPEVASSYLNHLFGEARI